MVNEIFCSNKQQKVDYLTKLKEEGNKLRDEKVKLQERLNKAQEKSEQLQKVKLKKGICLAETQ